MPVNSRPLTWLWAALLPAVVQAAPAKDEREPLGVSFRLGGKALFNLKSSLMDTRPMLGAGARYDDGYVLADSSGSATETWNWGYSNASQVIGGDVEFHRLDNSPRPGLDPGGGSAVFGGELVAAFEAFRFDWGKREAKFGVELGYSSLPFSADGNTQVNRSATYTTARYNLGAAIPPPAGYAGSFGRQGPLIDLNPSAGYPQSVTDVGTGTLDSVFDVDLHALRFGMWIEYPLTKRVSLIGSFGYAAVFADGNLRITESLTFANAAIPSLARTTSTVSKTDWLQGAYFELRANWRLNDRLSVFAGGEVRYQTDFELQSGDRSGQLDFGIGFGGTAGVMFEF
jgi:hypothetical protein